MTKFKMYAEYADGTRLYFTNTADSSDDAESLCMCDIESGTEEHGECTYYTGVHDGKNWIDGEWFDGFDEETGTYYKDED